MREWRAKNAVSERAKENARRATNRDVERARENARRAANPGSRIAEAKAYYERRKGTPEYKAEHKRNSRSRWTRKYETIVAYKVATGCADCGENHPVVLDLHHRNRSEKHPQLKSNGSRLERLSWDVIAAELEKCDVLCANCHRKREYGHLWLP